MAAEQDELFHARGFCTFVDSSPSPFHCVETMEKKLLQNGFELLSERSSEWNVEPNGRYYFIRNQSTLVSFAVGGQFCPGNGFTMMGGHTDSPCLIVKPKSHVTKQGHHLVGVETYGGGLWYTWFDRDLSVAGRVIVQNGDQFESRLVRIDRPILRVSSLCIHLQTAAERKAYSFNKENHLIPILCSEAACQLNAPASGHSIRLVQLLAEELGCDVADVKDFELCLYDTQKATLGGSDFEFINTARIDNQLTCYCLTEALIASLPTLENDENIRVCAYFDDEEVGSITANGADSRLMLSMLQSLSGNNPQQLNAGVAKSFMVSMDCAHAIHPNYSCKHEKEHAPALNGGVTIKYNSNQRYATNLETTFHMKRICEKYNLPLQEFVVRNDSPCGSTIGPKLSAQLGVRTLDIGLNQLSMHSIREMCGSKEVGPAVETLTHFFNEFVQIDQSLNINVEPSTKTQSEDVEM